MDVRKFRIGRIAAFFALIAICFFGMRFDSMPAGGSERFAVSAESAAAEVDSQIPGLDGSTASCAHDAFSHADATPLAADGGTLAAGNYYLTSDVNLKNGLTISSGVVNLCLNGYAIRYDSSKVSTITISGGTLNLYDCDSSHGVHYYTDNGKYWDFAESNTAETVGAVAYRGGIITGQRAVSAVRITSGNFNFYGGSIAGNLSSISGVVHMNGGGYSVTQWFGGNLSGNGATGSISILNLIDYNNHSKFSMTGGMLSDNYAEYSLIRTAMATPVSISNAVIVRNHHKGFGGYGGSLLCMSSISSGISNTIENSKFMNNDFTEANNRDNTISGSLSFSLGIFTVKNCEIVNNREVGSGSAFYVDLNNNTTLNIIDSRIENNVMHSQPLIPNYHIGVISYLVGKQTSLRLNVTGNTIIRGNRWVDESDHTEHIRNLFFGKPVSIGGNPFSGAVGISSPSLPTDGKPVRLFTVAAGAEITGTFESDVPGYGVYREGDAYYMGVTNLASLSATTPTKTAYEAYEDFDDTGMTVTAHYLDGTTSVVSDYTVTDGTKLQASQTSVTVSYTDSGATVTATVPITVTKKRLTKPAASSESFTYDGTAKRYLPSGYDETYMTISNNVQTNANEAGYAVTVGLKDPENCEWTTAGDPTYSFSIGRAQPMVTPKLSVTEVSAGASPVLSLSAGDTPGTIAWDEGQDWATIGTREFEWTFTPSTENYVAKTGALAVTIAPAKMIGVEATFAPPDGTTFRHGQSLEVLKPYLTVTGTYDNGTRAETESYTLSTGNGTLSEGECIVTVRAGEATTTFSVTVTAAGLVKIEVTTAPTKTTYDAFEPFDRTGMAVTATYTDGSTKKATGFTVAGELTTNSPTVTISYTENGETVTVSYEVTVKKREVTLPTVSGVYEYNGTEQAVILNGYDAKTMSIASGASRATHAGVYTFTVTLKDPTNYAFAGTDKDSCAIDWEIAAKRIAVDWGETALVYEAGKTQAPEASVATGIAGDTIALTVRGGAEAVGTYTATAAIESVAGTGTTADYVLTDETIEYEIVGIGVSVKWTMAPSYTYDGTDRIGTVSASYQNLAGETIALAVTVKGANPFRDAGTYTLVAAMTAPDSDVRLVGTSKTVTIQRAASETHPTASASSLIAGGAKPTFVAGDGDTAGTYAWRDGQDWTTAGTRAFGWTFEPTDAKNYTSAQGTLTLTIEAVVVTEIAAEFDAKGAEIFTSATLEELKKYIAVTAKRNTGETFSAERYELSFETGARLQAGTNVLKVSYSGRETTVEVTDVIAVALAEIRAVFDAKGAPVYVTATADKLKKYLTVTGRCNDGTERTLTEFEITIDGMLAIGTNAVKVTAEGRETTVVISDVLAVLPIGIEASFRSDGEPIYTAYGLDKLRTKIVVTVRYDDGSERATDAYTLAYQDGALLTVGDNVLTVEFGEFRTEVSIPDVKEARLLGIAVTKNPNRTNYTAFETFDRSGMIVTATFEYGTETAVAYTVTYRSGDCLHAEDTAVTIVVAYGAEERRAEVAVTVEKRTIALPTEIVADLAYNGRTQTVFPIGYDDENMKIEGNTALDAGRYSAVVTLLDAKNLCWEGGGTQTLTFEYEIRKADFDLSGVVFADVTVKEDGEKKTLAASGIPEWLAAQYSGEGYNPDGVAVPGIYVVTLALTPTGEYAKNYNVPTPFTATLTVTQAKLTSSDGNVVVEGGDGGLHPSYRIEIEDVTNRFAEAEISDGEVKQAYDIRLKKGNEIVQPDGEIEIRLFITPSMREEGTLRVYHCADDGTATDMKAIREGNYMVFKTTHLSEFVIVGSAAFPLTQVIGLAGGGLVCLVLLAILIGLIASRRRRAAERRCA